MAGRHACSRFADASRVFYGFALSAIRDAGAKRNYLVEGQTYDRMVFKSAIEPISKRFAVSHRAAQIRMIHLGLIRTNSAY